MAIPAAISGRRLKLPPAGLNRELINEPGRHWRQPRHMRRLSPVGLLVPLLLLILAVPLVVALMRANELFLLRVRGSELVRVRGRIPQKLLDDIGDVIARAGLDAIELRAVIEDGRPKMYASGAEVPRPVRQQLRNVVGQWQVSAIRSGPKARASRLSSPREVS